ncbi:MAG: DUF2252 family protein [Acetobacteraceae bacterium]
MDQIAKEGAVFTNWHGQASCTAGRASFLTGRLPIRSALSIVVAPGDENRLRKQTPTIAEYFQKNGYSTYFSGKWHVGDKPDDNDLDETLPAPWEWDVKRLVASFALAVRSNGLSDANGRAAAVAYARRYRRTMRDFSNQDVLETWYARLDEQAYLAMLPQSRKAVLTKRIAKATVRSSAELVFPKLVEHDGVQFRIRETPPTIFHAEESRGGDYMAMVRDVLAKCRDTLTEDRRVLFDRLRSVPRLGDGTPGPAMRQLRDVKLSPLVETYDAEKLSVYAEARGWVLARAHAKAGDPWTISEYLGSKGDFDKAMGAFALAYADQAERDHALLKAAARAGTRDVRTEG